MWTRATYFSYTDMNQLPTRINFFEPLASWGGSNMNEYSLSSNWDKGLFFTGQVGYTKIMSIWKVAIAKTGIGLSNNSNIGVLPIIMAISRSEPIR